MIPARFVAHRPRTIAEVEALLQQFGEDAKLLAGGQSLIPLMRFRFAAPAHLLDLSTVDGLAYVRRDGDQLCIGAMTTYAHIAQSPVVQRDAALMAHVATLIGDLQVQHRGTIGGSIAHSDPASDMATALLALDATVVTLRNGVRRERPLLGFATGFLETVLDVGEWVVEIRCAADPDVAWSYQSVHRRAEDWAIGAAALVRTSDSTRLALSSMGPVALRALHTENVLSSAWPGDEQVRAALDEEIEPLDDQVATSTYRRHLAAVLVRRAWNSAAKSV
ncbi:FAD binding domain-containing protein [Nocardioides sp.]|uniref:FAD binding domain-containing protein n=1 Tax=Nocardioides sp. TaxID=35761 RepID=UPI0037849AB9